MMEEFGQMPNDDPVHRVCLNGGGLTANLLTYGCVLQDLRLQGHAAPLVLGFDRFEHYLTRSPYFGAMAGRCANRIRDGHLELDGKTFQLDRNFLGKHTLHGGSNSTGKQLWRFVDVQPDCATLAITLEAGEMGFPGQLDAQVTFTLLTGGILDIRMGATTGETTLCNLAHHSYFILDNGANISGHQLQIAAEHYLPVDAELIPTGEVAKVSGTRFDFQTPRPVSQSNLLDHNFCLSDQREPLRPVAWFSSPLSGVTMECRTTEPGLQVYNGAKVDIQIPGLDGAPMGPCAGLAMEPQIWPDANHHPHFPQAVLRPDEPYDQHTQFVFSKETT